MAGIVDMIEGEDLRRMRRLERREFLAKGWVANELGCRGGAEWAEGNRKGECPGAGGHVIFRTWPCQMKVEGEQKRTFGKHVSVLLIELRAATARKGQAGLVCTIHMPPLHTHPHAVRTMWRRGPVGVTSI